MLIIHYMGERGQQQSQYAPHPLSQYTPGDDSVQICIVKKLLDSHIAVSNAQALV